MTPLEYDVASSHSKSAKLQVNGDVVALSRQVHRVLEYLVDDRFGHSLVFETCSRCNDLPVELDWRRTVTQDCLHLLGLEGTSQCVAEFSTEDELHRRVVQHVALVLVKGADSRNSNRLVLRVKGVTEALRECTPELVYVDKSVLLRLEAVLQLLLSLRQLVLRVSRHLPDVIPDRQRFRIVPFEEADVREGNRLEGTLDKRLLDISFIHFMVMSRQNYEISFLLEIV